MDDMTPGSDTPAEPVAPEEEAPMTAPEMPAEAAPEMPSEAPSEDAPAA